MIPVEAVQAAYKSWGVFRKIDGSRVRADITFRSEERALKFIDVFIWGRSEFEARELVDPEAAVDDPHRSARG